MAGIARDLDRMVDANRGNPNALMQRTPPPAAGGASVSPDLLKSLALQKLQSEAKRAEDEIRMSMEQNPGTIVEQRGKAALDRSLKEVTEAVTGVKANQQRNMVNRQQQMLGGRPGPPGPPGAPPRQMAGIAGQPTPNMARMAGGGIVSFRGGGETQEEQEFQAMLRGLVPGYRSPAPPAKKESFEEMMIRTVPGYRPPKNQAPMVNRRRPAPKVPLWKQREDKYNAMPTEALKKELKDIAASDFRIRTDLRPMTINKILRERERNLYDVNEAAMQGGGIVGSQGSGREAQAANLLRSIGMTPLQFKALPVSEQQRIGATLRTQRMANGGIVNFKNGGGIKVSDEQLAQLNASGLNITKEIFEGLTEAGKQSLLRTIDPSRSQFKADLAPGVREWILRREATKQRVDRPGIFSRVGTYFGGTGAESEELARRGSAATARAAATSGAINPPSGVAPAQAQAGKLESSISGADFDFSNTFPQSAAQEYKVRTVPPTTSTPPKATYTGPAGTQRGIANIANRDVFMSGAKDLTSGKAYDPLLAGLAGITSDTGLRARLLRSPYASSSGALGRIGSALQAGTDREVAEKAAKLGAKASIIDAKKKSQGTGITAGTALTGDVSKELYDEAKGSALAQKTNIEATIARETNRLRGLDIVNMSKARQLDVMKDLTGLISGVHEFYDKLTTETFQAQGVTGVGKDTLKDLSEAIALKRKAALKPLLDILKKVTPTPTAAIIPTSRSRATNRQKKKAQT